MIVIVDYGLGNIKSFVNVYKKLNIAVSIAKNAEDLKNASKIILPGVGSFDYAMTRLNNSGMRATIDDLVLNKGIPVLGICVGMQMLGHSSEEGNLSGLGYIDGNIKKFDVSNFVQKTKLPHMGWNDVVSLNNSRLFDGMGRNMLFYFLHSYYFSCNNPENVIAYSDYGKRFDCAVNSGNIYGVQFHPEKSHSYGVQLLNNFAKL